MDYWAISLLCISLLGTISRTGGVELTFELPENAKQCFYEEIKEDTTALLEFQVVTGGLYDVDVVLKAPNKEIIYNQVKTQFDSHQFTASMTGAYEACFSNEFSTFSHKLVYMDFRVGDQLSIDGISEHSTAMTQMETYAQSVHKNLISILEFQTHHRLREAQGRKRAEDLNTRVLVWSIMETLTILIISIGQDKITAMSDGCGMVTFNVSRVLSIMVPCISWPVCYFHAQFGLRKRVGYLAGET